MNKLAWTYYSESGPRNIHFWQYNGVAPFRDIVKWCEETFGPANSVFASSEYVWSLHKQEGLYLNDAALVVFTMRWS